MVKFVEHLPAETIVLVRAVVQDPHSHGQSDIHYTSIHNVEVRVTTVSNLRRSHDVPWAGEGDVLTPMAVHPSSASQLHVVSQVTVPPPFDIHDASRPETDFAVRRLSLYNKDNMISGVRMMLTLSKSSTKSRMKHTVIRSPLECISRTELLH